MAAPLDLAKPNRTIHVGVILMDSYVFEGPPCSLLTRDRETEILDVAPVDLLYGMSKHLVHDFADGFMPPNLKEQALDMDFHWVNQTGKTARLTGGLRVQPTVRLSSSSTVPGV